jgi:hypothetical protein
MSWIRPVTVALGVVLLFLGPASSQPVDQDMEQAAREFEEWVEAMSEYVADVRFDEADVKSYIRYWEEFSQLDVREDIDDETDWEQLKDVDFILGHAAYRSWIASHGLDPEDWLRKTLRIQMMVMKDQMARSHGMMQQQGPEQMAMIEEQCKNVGPELCRQMKEAMAASMAMSEGMGRSVEKMPEPTAGEAALLEQYQGEIMALMEIDEEEEEDW